MSDKMRNALECCLLYMVNNWTRDRVVRWEELTGEKKVNAVVLRRVIEDALDEPEQVIVHQQHHRIIATPPESDLISLMGGNG